MKKIEYPVKRCKKCDKPLRDFNKSGVCSNCNKKDKWIDRYEQLEKEYKHHKELCRILHLEMYNKLKKYEPNISWSEPD